MAKSSMVLLSLAFVVLFSSTYIPVAESQFMWDLRLSKTVSDETPNVGDTISYTITVTNVLPLGISSAVAGIKVTDELPPGVTHDTHSASKGAYDPSTGVWDVGSLKPAEGEEVEGESATLEVSVKVDEGAAGTTITNTAEVTAMDQIDDRPSDNIARVDIVVQSSGDVQNPVEIDIKPGSDPNSINPNSKGVIPVAILTTENFDASSVDGSTVIFGPKDAQSAHGNGHLEDVDGDGDLDWVGHFRTQETGIQAGDTEATLTGKTVDGDGFQGTDAIVTVGKSKKPKAAPALRPVRGTTITWGMIRAKH
jgi:uncharacterized repeat protein (TIGR01451 family)